MRTNGLLLLVVAALAVGGFFVLRDRGHTAAPTPTTTPTTIAGTMAVEAYYYRGAALVPIEVRVPKTQAVATAALAAVLEPPPAGFRTALPATNQFVLQVRDGVATLTPPPRLPRTAEAQLVYTLTQFPSVTSVAIGSTLVTRDDYLDLTADAPIFVETPLRDTTVKSPVHVSGTAMVFEATLVLEVRQGGRLLDTKSITATNGAPDRGTFDTSLELQPGTYQLVFYEPSAADGSHLHSTTVEIHVAA